LYSARYFGCRLYRDLARTLPCSTSWPSTSSLSLLRPRPCRRLPLSAALDSEQLIADLEDHLGIELIQRTTRNATITPEGAAYYERAIKLIGELEDMDAAVSNRRAQVKGRLRIYIGPLLANLILIPGAARLP
jgi:hypothetical protein